VNTRKTEADGRATLLQWWEVNVIAGVAACPVGAMTSLLLLDIVYTNRHRERRTERPIS